MACDTSCVVRFMAVCHHGMWYLMCRDVLDGVPLWHVILDVS